MDTGPRAGAGSSLLEGLPPEEELARTAADTSPLRELVALAAWGAHPDQKIAEGVRRTAREFRATGVGDWHQR